MAHGIGGAGNKVVGRAWVAAAETLKVVCEEGLEGRLVAVGLAALATVVTALIAGPGTSMSTPSMTDVRRYWRSRTPRLYILPKPTMPPSATVAVVSEALLRQEGQLELQSIGVLRKLTQKRGAGRVREAHAVTEKVMKVGLRTFPGRPRALNSAQHHRRIEARHCKVALQVESRELVVRVIGCSGVGDWK
ncbi:sigma-54-dependent Fis family transcriptional regulator [Babesia caballi]|uniref:Sigma-54-dependent Fis family transcriptional regulator n=1 Tax=Babesia caballi TaxID=5871 RepID=A0AAV4LXQ7_BABCB|nr:sigma-54-dependent Fis family transcriptional regulator [Babesia caballi]